MNFIIFDEWEPRHEYITSGCREKVWLYNKESNLLGLFKYPKVNTYGVNTFEHVSEHLASRLAVILGVNCCKTILGTYNGREGSLSCFIPKNKNETMLQGINLIKISYPNYDENTRYDSSKKECYSVEMINKCLFDNAQRDNFYKMLIFDYFIGHTDRHDSNWALLYCDGSFRFSPLYDNGSSLCAYVNEADICSFLTDKVRFESLVNTKSKSAIGINYKQKVKHYDLINELINRNSLDIKYINDTYLSFTDADITNVLNEYKGLLSEKRIGLLFKFLQTKREMLRNILYLREEK